MKVLVTGNKGFVGSHLQKFWEKDGHEVIGLDNNFNSSGNDVKGIIGDIRNKKLVYKLVKDVDVVAHLAAIIHIDYSNEYPDETIDVNINGTLNVLEACKKYGKKMIFASSSEIYGSSQTEFMDETHPLDGQSVYAATKIAGDRLCKAYNDAYGMDVSILRNFNIAGEWQSFHKEGSSYGAVLGIFIRQALEGKPLTVFGSGEQERDYLAVDDAVMAYDVLKNDQKGGVYNAASGKAWKIIDLAKMIISLTNSKSTIQHVEKRKGEVMRLCGNASKIERLGWYPTISIEEILRRMIEWHQNRDRNLRRLIE